MKTKEKKNWVKTEGKGGWMVKKSAGRLQKDESLEIKMSGWEPRRLDRGYTGDHGYMGCSTEGLVLSKT